MHLLYMWSTNETISDEMFQYFNYFRDMELSDDEILEAIKIVEGEEYSPNIPLDFIFYINEDIKNEFCLTRYCISYLQMFYIYGVRILNAFSTDALDIIESAINNLKNLCDNNNVICNVLGEKIDELANDSWNDLCNEIIEPENDD